jgi:Na+/H+ antiporter NhaC
MCVELKEEIKMEDEEGVKDFDSFPVKFRGGIAFAFVPLIIATLGCILFFMVWGTFSLVNLAMAAFVGLILGSLLAKNMGEFWKAALKGMSSEVCSILILIIIVVGMFTQMMARAGVAEGFVWLGSTTGITGSLFVVFVFIACCIIASATGTSLGTVFSGFPIFYPAGILLGADPVFLAGAILSGGIFGDNLSPISDTTIVSATTQRFKSSGESADIAGTVSHRFKYAIIAAGLAAVAFLVFGGGVGTAADVAGADILAQYSNPLGLVMLIPVAVLLIVAFIKRNIFVSVAIGAIVGIGVGLVSGALNISDILSLEEGVAGGFLIAGVNAKLGIVAYLIAIFGIMGVMRGAGVLDRLIHALANSRLTRTARGTEWVNALGIMTTGAFVASANGPALIIYGPVADELGKTKGLHPYRRANVIDCMACALPIVIPFTSLFIFVVLGVVEGLTENYAFLTGLSPIPLAMATLYPIALFIVMAVAITTGWGRIFETKDGKSTKDPAESIVAE